MADLHQVPIERLAQITTDNSVKLLAADMKSYSFTPAEPLAWFTIAKATLTFLLILRIYKLQIPELQQLDCTLEVQSYEPSIDSSNMQPKIWVQLAETIEKSYKAYDGFVILHGSDTMAFTASALSFMLENLNKPVILPDRNCLLACPEPMPKKI